MTTVVRFVLQGWGLRDRGLRGSGFLYRIESTPSLGEWGRVRLSLITSQRIGTPVRAHPPNTPLASTAEGWRSGTTAAGSGTSSNYT